MHCITCSRTVKIQKNCSQNMLTWNGQGLVFNCPPLGIWPAWPWWVLATKAESMSSSALSTSHVLRFTAHASSTSEPSWTFSMSESAEIPLQHVAYTISVETKAELTGIGNRSQTITWITLHWIKCSASVLYLSTWCTSAKHPYGILLTSRFVTVPLNLLLSVIWYMVWRRCR